MSKNKAGKNLRSIYKLIFSLNEDNEQSRGEKNYQQATAKMKKYK
jgi:hypothetical protein